MLVKFANFYLLFMAMVNHGKDITSSPSVPYIALTDPSHQRISLSYEL